MPLQKLHIILSKTYFCDSFYKKKRAKKGRLDAIIADSDTNDDKLRRQKLKDMNVFIDSIGQLELHTKPSKDPFVLDISSANIDGIGRHNRSVCYRAAGNLLFNIAIPGFKIEIKPIVQVFPSGTVSIIFSCFYNASRKCGEEHLNIFRQILESFTVGRCLEHMTTGNPAFMHIKSLEDCAGEICDRVDKTFPELCIRDAFCEAISFVHVIHDEGLCEDGFRDICKQITPPAMGGFTVTTDIPEESYYLKTNPFFLVRSDFSTIFYGQKCNRNEPYFNSWRFFKHLEFAAAERMVYRFLGNHARDVLRDINEEQYKLLSRSMFVPTFYSREIDILYGNQDARYYALDQFSRKVVNMYYGGEQVREDVIRACHEEIKAMNELLQSRGNQHKAFLKAIIRHVPTIMDAARKLTPG